jgi:hypothetical protein
MGWLRKSCVHGEAGQLPNSSSRMMNPPSVKPYLKWRHRKSATLVPLRIHRVLKKSDTLMLSSM